jgi:hypothetical protein
MAKQRPPYESMISIAAGSALRDEELWLYQRLVYAKFPVWSRYIDYDPVAGWASSAEAAIENSPFVIVIDSPADRTQTELVGWADKHNKQIILVSLTQKSAISQLPGIPKFDLMNDREGALAKLIEFLGEKRGLLSPFVQEVASQCRVRCNIMLQTRASTYHG